MITSTLNNKNSETALAIHRESGAAMILIYVAVLIFLYFSILFLDIPYLERVSRSVQRAADAASMAGVVKLTRRGTALAQNGWRECKRAAIYSLKQNGIAGISDSLIPATFPNGSSCVSTDTLDATKYGCVTFPLSNGPQSGSLTIERGVYERPLNPTVAIGTIFYPMEVGNPFRVGGQCISGPPGTPPTSCNGSPLVEDAADSVRVTLSVQGIPTLFGKLLGINSFVSVTRTSTAGPM